jgi:hypothetical protein
MITEEELLKAERPILVTLDANEIGRLYADSTTPDGFVQYILTKLKARAPGLVEGTLRLRLKYGRIARVKDSVQGKGFFDYLWISPAYIAKLNEMGGLADMANPMGTVIGSEAGALGA